MSAEAVKAAPHRPSRRGEIVAGAVRVFARNGLVDASVQQIADEVGLATTAVYYHFDSKEELFGAALRAVLERIHDVVQTARPDDAAADAEALDRVIDAVWQWIDEHPDEARLFHLHLSGAAGEARQVREEFDRLHINRAFAYLPATGGTSTRTQTVRLTAHALAVRTLIAALTFVSVLEGEGAPLAELPQPEVRTSMRELAHRIVGAEQPGPRTEV